MLSPLLGNTLKYPVPLSFKYEILFT